LQQDDQLQQGHLVGDDHNFCRLGMLHLLAEGLVKNFSGKGLVPDAIIASPNFLLSVALGAGLTVMLATVAGFPVSTTHGLTGALVGSGLVAVGTEVNFAKLGGSFFLPLSAVH